jgi:hypothetical protein
VSAGELARDCEVRNPPEPPHCEFQAGGQPGPDQMQLGLAHRALQTEHQPVVEIGRVVDPVRVLSVARIAASLGSPLSRKASTCSTS